MKRIRTRTLAFPAFIYVLEDPREPGNIRYIGSTQSLPTRINRHIHEAKTKRGGIPKLEEWIGGLLSQGIEPSMRVLWEGPLEKMLSCEQKAIYGYRRLGFDLLNTTDTFEYRDAIRQRMMGSQIARKTKGIPKSAAHRAALSRYWTGRPRPWMKGNKNAKKQS